MDLVEVKKSEVFCDSQMVSRKFGQKHNKVIRTIKKLLSDMSKLRGTQGTPKVTTEERAYRGLKYTAYLMDQKFFSLLAMRFEGQKALEWQIKFNEAFYNMEKILIQEASNKENEAWLTQRNSGKLIRHDTTDVIKEFVDYATEQGSESAKFYYKHITNATYKAIGLIVQKKPKLRDTLAVIELCNLATAEFLAQRSIKKHMADKLPYKAIYKFVKADLERFAEGLMVGEIEKQIR